jgi:hypothetical protein
MQHSHPLNRLLLGLTLVIMGVTAACGGSTAQPPVTGCQIDGGCVSDTFWSSISTVANFGHTGTGAAINPAGVFANVGLASMVCDATCIHESGWIRNFVMMGDASLHTTLEVGYGVDWNSAAETAGTGNYSFYWADNRPVSTGGYMYTYHPDPTTVAVGSISNQNFAVYQINGNTYGLTVYDPTNPSTNRVLAQTSVAGFSPGSFVMGQRMFGTQGEGANWAGFGNASYAVSPLGSFFSAPAMSAFPLHVTTPVTGGVTHPDGGPPYSFWFVPPGGTFIGTTVYPSGIFETQCCVANT